MLADAECEGECSESVRMLDVKWKVKLCVVNGDTGY